RGLRRLLWRRLGLIRLRRRLGPGRRPGGLGRNNRRATAGGGWTKRDDSGRRTATGGCATGDWSARGSLRAVGPIRRWTRCDWGRYDDWLGQFWGRTEAKPDAH